MLEDVKSHYDKLIDIGNDPVKDSLKLQKYMDKWDGQIFIDLMKLDKSKKVLEIGIGTGRIARKVAPLCKKLVGVDISQKTIETAKNNLKSFNNIEFLIKDFMEYKFDNLFDVIYSSLTLMHFKDKNAFQKKVASILNNNGIYCLSIDKNQNDYIEMGDYKVKIFPDSLEDTKLNITLAGMEIIKIMETDFAFILISEKKFESINYSLLR